MREYLFAIILCELCIFLNYPSQTYNHIIYILRWTRIRDDPNATDAFDSLDQPQNTPQSYARYLITACKCIIYELQQQLAPGLVHMVISLEPNSNRVDSHACFLTIIRDKSKDQLRILKIINYLTWKYGLMPKASGAALRLSSPTLGMHIRLNFTLCSINQRFEYHYKIQTKHVGSLSVTDQRAHHRYCQIPVMAAGICVEYTCNQHPCMKYQLNRQWLITVEEQHLTPRAGVVTQKNIYYPPLPVYDKRTVRVDPKRNDFKFMLRMWPLSKVTLGNRVDSIPILRSRKLKE